MFCEVPLCDSAFSKDDVGSSETHSCMCVIEHIALTTISNDVCFHMTLNWKYTLWHLMCFMYVCQHTLMHRLPLF